MKSLKTTLLLVICVQIAVPPAFAASSAETAEAKGTAFIGQINRFVGEYKKRFKPNDVNEEMIRLQLDRVKLNGTLKSWDQAALRNRAATPNTDAAILKQRATDLRLRYLRGEAQKIIKGIFQDSFSAQLTGAQPDPATFNNYMVELYSMYVQYPEVRPALELFFEELGNLKFNQDELIQMEKQRSFISNMYAPYVKHPYYMTAIVGGLFFMKRWPKSSRLFEIVANRFSAIKGMRARLAERAANRNTVPRLTPEGTTSSPWWSSWFSRGKKPSLLARTPAPAQTAPMVMRTIPQMETEASRSMIFGHVRLFMQKNGRRPSEQELAHIRDVVATNMKAIKALNITDSSIFAGVAVSVRLKGLNLGRALNPQEVNETYQTVLQWQQSAIAHALAPKPAPAPAPAPRPVAKPTAKAPTTPVAAPREFEARNVKRWLWAPTEQALLGSMKIFKRTPYQGVRDTARFFDIALKTSTAYSVLATTYYNLPNTQYSLIPEDEITHAVNAMAILNLTCKAESLNAKTLALANRINVYANGDSVQNEFVKLVTEMKSLATEYSTTLRFSGLYTNEIPEVYTLPTVGISQDRATGTITYLKQHEGETYPIQVPCPSLRGKDPIKTVNIESAHRLLVRSVDRLALVEILNEMTAEEVEVNGSKIADRLLQLNPTTYNAAIPMLIERLLAQEPYMNGLLVLLDSKIDNDKQNVISNKKQRHLFRDIKAGRIKNIQAARN